MRVYEFSAPDGFEFVSPIDRKDSETLRRLDGRPVSDTWTPIKVRLVTSDEHNRALAESDFPWPAATAPALRKEAVDALGSLFLEDAELLPLDCQTAPLWLLNVVRVVDAFDPERSDFATFPNTARIMHVRKYAFVGERLDGVGLFRVPQLLTYSAFVTERIVAAVEGADLRGVRFRLLWQGKD